MFTKKLLCAKYFKQVFGKTRQGFQTLHDVSDLTEEQKSIQKMALDFAANKLAPFSAEWEKKHHFPVDVIKESASLGFGSIYTSAENGGCGLGRLEASLIFEALSTGDIPVAAYISIHNMNNWILDANGSQELKQIWSEKMNTMEVLTSYCLTEPGSGSDAAGMQTTARRDGGDYVINGSKCFISGGGVSDLYFLMCLTGEKKVSTIIVEKGTKGLSFGKLEEKMGWKCSPTTVVNFDDVRVPARNLIGKEGDGFKSAMKGLDGGRINIASCSLGGAARALDIAKDYLKTRKQFGKTLENFQYLQFKLADMATDLTASRLMVRNAARMMDMDHPQKTMYSAMAKQFATDRCFEVANYALQMHGGYGYLADYPLEKILRDMRVHQILEGTNEIMRLVISKRLLSA